MIHLAQKNDNYWWVNIRETWEFKNKEDALQCVGKLADIKDRNGKLHTYTFKKDEKGNIQSYTDLGRIRKNWKQIFNEISRKHLKEECEECGSKKNLTIHHDIPISKCICLDKANCQTLCQKCHKTRHWKENWEKKE